MTTPDPSSTWLGGPLRSALAIRAVDESLGTLGVVVRIAEQAYFTCSYHVVGPSPALPRAIDLYVGNNTWQPVPALQHARLDDIALDDELSRLDLTLLPVSVAAANETPDGKPISRHFGGPEQGEEFLFRGLRESTWGRVTYAGIYEKSDELWTRPLPLEAARLGVIDFIENRAANSYTGDSGAVFWSAQTTMCFAVGHLIAVSVTGRRGLILNYRTAFAQLNLDANVVGGAG